MDVFNPKILDASIRDVASCLSDNQKADLLLYAMRSLHYEGRSRTVIENAIQSCLQISTLSPENTAKARILRARARLVAGCHFSAQEDLQAALDAEPDNPEAKALLHQRSVTVEKLLAPLPRNKDRFSSEIWREIALYLPRRDLKSLLFVPHALSRVASSLLFRQLDLHFHCPREEDEDSLDAWAAPYNPTHRQLSAEKEEDDRQAQRSADILTRIIVDSAFGSAVRTLRIYGTKGGRDSSMAFQTGMLTNALPKLINLRNVHISAGSESIVPVLRILQSSCHRLRGLSMHSPDPAPDLSFLSFHHLDHLSCSFLPIFPSSSPSSSSVHSSVHTFIAQNRSTLRILSLSTPVPSPNWTLPTHILSIRNLTSIHFAGHFPTSSHIFEDILSNGRQLECLSLTCCALDCSNSSSSSGTGLPTGAGGASASQQFRSLQKHHTTTTSSPLLPFLRTFSFSVEALGRRNTSDPDLFPAIAAFLRGRTQLRSLTLQTPDDPIIQRAVGFDASVWGVLPSLTGLKSLAVTYPGDLAPGLATWLIPRGVKALRLTVEGVKDPLSFFALLRPGIPPTLRFVGLSPLPSLKIASAIIEHGFPMIHVLCIGGSYWTVLHRDHDSSPRVSENLAKNVGVGRDGRIQREGREGRDGSSRVLPFELELWPRRRVAYHAKEWLDWLGCEDAVALVMDGEEFDG